MACSNESATDGEKGLMLGIDEAGRGPVLGPLVYGICFCPITRAQDLRNMGFADSKTLNLEARDKFRLQIEATEWIDYKVDVIMPQKLSAKMLRKHKYNLNLISHDSAIHLVQSTINEGFDIREVTFENYIDTIAITRIVCYIV